MNTQQAKAQQQILVDDIRHLQKRLKRLQPSAEEGVRLQELLEHRQDYFWTLEQIITDESPEVAA